MQKVDFFSSSDSLTMTSTTAKTFYATSQTSFVHEVDEMQRRCSLSAGHLLMGFSEWLMLMLQPHMLNH